MGQTLKIWYHSGWQFLPYIFWKDDILGFLKNPGGRQGHSQEFILGGYKF